MCFPSVFYSSPSAFLLPFFEISIATIPLVYLLLSRMEDVNYLDPMLLTSPQLIMVSLKNVLWIAKCKPWKDAQLTVIFQYIKCMPISTGNSPKDNRFPVPHWKPAVLWGKFPVPCQNKLGDKCSSKWKLCNFTKIQSSFKGNVL